MKKILSHSPRTNSPKKGGSGPLISKEHCFTIDRTPHLVLDTSPCSQESEDLKTDLKEQQPEILGMLNIQVKKRTYQTPKEINQYLKENKKEFTINQIKGLLNLPQTQVEHYFRTDKGRAIPSPQIWEQLKKILSLDNTYDKEVLEFYQKEMKYEMTRRIYNSQKISPTLSSSNVLVSPKLTSMPRSFSARSFQQSKITEMLPKSTPM